MIYKGGMYHPSKEDPLRLILYFIVIDQFSSNTPSYRMNPFIYNSEISQEYVDSSVSMVLHYINFRRIVS